MVVKEVLLGGEQRERLVFVASLKRFDRAVRKDLLELQLERAMWSSPSFQLSCLSRPAAR